MTRPVLFDDEGVILPWPDEARSLLPLMARSPKGRHAGCRILIASAQASEREVLGSSATRILTWSLDRYGIEWRQQDVLAVSHLDGYDAILFWPYGNKRRVGFQRQCSDVERKAKELGIPVINSLVGCNYRHSWCLAAWRLAEIPCACFQILSPEDELALNYPVILRTDRLHCGENMHVATTSAEARHIRAHADPPIDIAIEFLDTKWSDGLYRKWRSFVVGHRVVPRQLEVCPDWKVDLTRGHRQAVLEDRAFMIEREPQLLLMLRAAKALDSDIVALDYSRLEDGRYVFWEANRAFDMALFGEMLFQFQALTGRSDDECVAAFRELGDAICDLILARAAGIGA